MPRPQLQQHQIEAAAAAMEELASFDRAQLVMACGTGKTFAYLEIMRRRAGEIDVIQAPTIALCGQIVAEATHYDPRDAVLLAATQRESAASGIEAATDPTRIAAFLARPGRKLIVSTYLSAPNVGAALRARKAMADMLVFDEAHRAAGTAGRRWSRGLHDGGLPARKRLFVTATQRMVAAAYIGEAVASMADPAQFGRVAYELPFGVAVERGIICEIDVVTLIATGAETSAFSPKLHLPAILEARRAYNIRKGISFHGRIAEAEGFAHALEKAGLAAWHVSAHTPPARRQAIMREFAASDEGFITNARMLSEGIDVPDADAVMIGTAKRSPIDLQQCIGRAARKAPGKKKGWVIIPAIMPAGMNVADAMRAPHLSHLWTTLLGVASLTGYFDRTTTRTKEKSHIHVIGYDGWLKRLTAKIEADIQEIAAKEVSARAFGLRNMLWHDMAESVLQSAQKKVGLTEPQRTWLHWARHGANLSAEQQAVLARIEEMFAARRDERDEEARRHLDALRSGASFYSNTRAAQAILNGYVNPSIRAEYEEIMALRARQREQMIEEFFAYFPNHGTKMPDGKAHPGYPLLRAEERRDSAIWKRWLKLQKEKETADLRALEEMVVHYEMAGRVSDRKAYSRITKYPGKYPDLHRRLRVAQSKFRPK